jgi:carboxypeptidase C (cathepsin A)
LRIEPDQFQDRLLTDDGRVIGRYDARITGISYEPGDSGGYDPSYAAVLGGYTAGFNSYVRDTLKFESDLPYEVVTDVSPWKMPESRYLHGGEILRRAMIKNNHLHVWVVSGYFDLAVPYFAVVQTLRELNLDRAIRGNVRQSCYAAGHMVYTVPTELAKLKLDYETWLSAVLDERPRPASEPLTECGTSIATP